MGFLEDARAKTSNQISPVNTSSYPKTTLESRSSATLPEIQRVASQQKEPSESQSSPPRKLMNREHSFSVVNDAISKAHSRESFVSKRVSKSFSKELPMLRATSFRHTRKEEVREFTSQLDALAKGGMAEADADIFCVVEAEPGMGRSSAVMTYLGLARERGLRSFSLQATHGDESIPYGLFRKLFITIIGNENFLTEMQQKQTLKDLIQRCVEPENADMVLMQLKTMLGLVWSSDPPSKQNTLQNPRIRDTSHIHNILLSILNEEPCCIVMDDVHYCDELSWNEMEILVKSSQMVAYMLTIHARQWISYDRCSFEAPKHQIHPGATFDSDFEMKQQTIPTDAYMRLLQMQRSRRMHLKALPFTTFEAFLHAIVPDIPSDAKNQIYNISSGIPFWITYIGRIILEYGSTEFLDYLSKSTKNPLNCVIEFQLEQLTKDEMNIILLCSIIGDDFSVDMLIVLLTDPSDIENIQEYLKNLKEKGFLKDINHRRGRFFSQIFS